MPISGRIKFACKILFQVGLAVGLFFILSGCGKSFSVWPDLYMTGEDESEGTVVKETVTEKTPFSRFLTEEEAEWEKNQETEDERMASEKIGNPEVVQELPFYESQMSPVKNEGPPTFFWDNIVSTSDAADFSPTAAAKASDAVVSLSDAADFSLTAAAAKASDAVASLSDAVGFSLTAAAKASDAVASLSDAADFSPTAAAKASDAVLSLEKDQGNLLGEIYFRYKKSIFTREALNVLVGKLEFLKKNKNQRLEIRGYCDHIGSRDYNKVLGQARADAVMGFLVNNGIESSRLKAVSYGKNILLCRQEVESCQKQNRRVDLIKMD